MEEDWPVIIRTRSPFVLRDLDIVRDAEMVRSGVLVTTEDVPYRGKRAENLKMLGGHTS